MTADPMLYFWLFVFVLVSVSVLQAGKLGMDHWLRWDTGEKERLFQQKISDLQRELDKAKDRVVILEKQIELLLGQYNDAIIRLNTIRIQHESALEDAKKLREELDDLRRDLPRMEANSHPRRRVLIAVIGNKDPGLELDLTSLRAVQNETGLAFERITEATPDKLKKTLDRSRMQRNITYLHLSVRSGKEGYQLGDQVVSAEWLSGILGGVLILVVAGADSDWVGDFLGVVPYVVTMSESAPSGDAAQFSRAFWMEIGKGFGPVRALTTALDRAPATMQEYVVRHWID